ncbi:hypothetical protein [Pseudomonas protegens]|uniref:hypothetical protein n=1 Tax=Pseudomonas protegens TaxID=380021 RepID=UPI0011CE240B|nr:hypothetical protein [Pseudomonas protegens]
MKSLYDCITATRRYDQIPAVAIERTQHAVGQGGFHSCTIRIRGNRAFEYVFDCGTKSKGPCETKINVFLEQHVHQYQPGDGIIDALFISHLDIDHYAGAQTLCALKTVSRIFLPYFTIDDILLMLATHEVDADERTADYLSNLRKIANGHRLLFGIPVTVIGGDPQPGEDTTEAPTDNPQRLRAVQIDANGRKQPISDNLPNGATIGLSYKEIVLPWVLRPWSYKQTAKAREAMSQAIDKITSLKNLKDCTSAITAEDLKAVKDNAAALKKQCAEILFEQTGLRTESHNSNSPSICLYSGPQTRLTPNLDFQYERRASSDKRLRNNPTGWITTGDCLMSKHWPEFRKHFADVLTHVGTYVVPHHGAAGNHSVEFIDAIPGRLAIICARYTSSHHPSRAVMDCLHEVDDLWLVAHEYAKPITELVSFNFLETH